MKQKKLDSMKFLGAGMSRRVYADSEKTCLKIPIEGREEAGIMQNQNEFNNITLAESNGLKCFPEIISRSKDYMELKVKRYDSVTDDDWKKLYGKDFTECLGAFLNDDLYNDSYPEYFGFGLVGYFREIMSRFNINNLDDLVQVLKNGKLFYTCIRYFKSPFSGRYYHGEAAEKFLRKIFVENRKRHQVFRDIFKFATRYPENFVLEDLWNNSQWGKETDANGFHFVVLDAGFDRKIQISQHYKTWNIINLDAVVKTNPGEGMTFNGIDIDELKDPEGNNIDYKFFTSKNSEYVLSSNLKARRIKSAGLADDGLWGWTDKTIFVNHSTLMRIIDNINAIFKTLKPIRIKSDWKTKLDFQKLNDRGEWETFLSEKEFSTKPVIGMHTLEFLFDGEIIRKYHPGHDVSWIENDHTSISRLAS